MFASNRFETVSRVDAEYTSLTGATIALITFTVAYYLLALTTNILAACAPQAAESLFTLSCCSKKSLRVAEKKTGGKLAGSASSKRGAMVDDSASIAVEMASNPLISPWAVSTVGGTGLGDDADSASVDINALRLSGDPHTRAVADLLGVVASQRGVPTQAMWNAVRSSYLAMTRNLVAMSGEVRDLKHAVVKGDLEGSMLAQAAFASAVGGKKRTQHAPRMAGASDEPAGPIPRPAAAVRVAAKGIVGDDGAVTFAAAYPDASEAIASMTNPLTAARSMDAFRPKGTLKSMKSLRAMATSGKRARSLARGGTAADDVIAPAPVAAATRDEVAAQGGVSPAGVDTDGIDVGVTIVNPLRAGPQQAVADSVGRIVGAR